MKQQTREFRRINIEFTRIEGSGPRHTRSRGVDASVRRGVHASTSEAEGGRHEGDDGGDHIIEAGDDHDPITGFEDSLGSDAGDDSFDHTYSMGHQASGSAGLVGEVDDGGSSSMIRVRRAAGGRFASSTRSSGASTRPRAGVQSRNADTSWLVQDVMPGGPVDGSLIPSYAAHIAPRIWSGEDRQPLKCHIRSQWCTQLAEWERSMSAELQSEVAATGLHHLPSIMYIISTGP